MNRNKRFHHHHPDQPIHRFTHRLRNFQLLQLTVVTSAGTRRTERIHLLPIPDGKQDEAEAVVKKWSKK